ncbi:MAG TPA: flagellar motor protein MotD [Casimicrobiaceae bacterium]|jgi:chemotaxis protein MotB|nr:flagellar motor protein MotD [Casimicrobiaceae bacterium]
MARRRHEEEHENHERWLVSYADFITLLFSFFVVMYAISTLSESKYKVLSDSLMQAFRHDRVVTAQTTGLAPINRTTQTPARQGPRVTNVVRYQQEKKLLAIATKITDALRALMQTGQVKLTQLPHGLAVEINASVLFAPGQAALQPEAVPSLVDVAHTLADVDNVIHIEGHTDNLPIQTPLYPSNWELSGARASSVVRLLAANGVAPSRLRAVGFAENHPVDSNDTPAGRQRNRRVTLLILADEPEPQGEPLPLSTPAEASLVPGEGTAGSLRSVAAHAVPPATPPAAGIALPPPDLPAGAPPAVPGARPPDAHVTLLPAARPPAQLAKSG